jgi:YVTN family beta-propeller protein
MTTPARLPIYFDPIRAHRSYGVPDRYEFVPDRTADDLYIFDLAARRRIRHLKVGAQSDVTATTVDGRYLYVAGKYLSVVDLETFEIVRTFAGEGRQHNYYAINFFPDGRRLFLFSGDGAITVLAHVDEPARLSVEKVMQINTWTPPDSSVGGKGYFTADGRRYVNANWHTHTVFVLDLEADYALTTLVPGGLDKPDDLVVPAGERKGYTASHAGRADARGAVHVFDLAGGQILRAIEVGRHPAGLTVSPDGRIVYVTNVPDGSFTAINAATDEVLYTASAAACYRAAGITGDHLDIEGVSVSADGQTLYAYAVNFGALVIFDDLGGENRPCLISGKGV